MQIQKTFFLQKKNKIILFSAGVTFVTFAGSATRQGNLDTSDIRPGSRILVVEQSKSCRGWGRAVGVPLSHPREPFLVLHPEKARLSFDSRKFIFLLSVALFVCFESFFLSLFCMYIKNSEGNSSCVLRGSAAMQNQRILTIQGFQPTLGGQ